MNFRGRERRKLDPRTGRLTRVIGRVRPLIQPPPDVRRARLDNLALVPANLLPLKSAWQAIANRLPDGTLLIVMPPLGTARRGTFARVAASLRARGRAVRVVAAEQLV